MQEKTKEILESLNWRAAVKVYGKNKTVDSVLVNTILEAGRLAPTAYGIQPFKIIVVADKDLRIKIREASFDQAKVTEASLLFVLAARTDVENNIDQYVENIAKVREVSVESLQEFKKNMLSDICSRSEADKLAWASRQAYIALGFILQTASELRVDASPMEGFLPNKVDEILNLKDLNLRSVGLFVLGHRGDDKYSEMKKVRFGIIDLMIIK